MVRVGGRHSLDPVVLLLLIFRQTGGSGLPSVVPTIDLASTDADTPVTSGMLSRKINRTYSAQDSLETSANFEIDGAWSLRVLLSVVNHSVRLFFE